MLNLFRVILVIGCHFALVACSEESNKLPTFKVAERPLSIVIEARGEIEAAESQRILSPGQRPMVIDWLAPENSQVKKGDVIARFDAVQLSKSGREEQLKMMMLQEDMRLSDAEQFKSSEEINAEKAYVAYEYSFAERFAIDDVRLYSKLEILETSQNKDYLKAKDQFLNWKSGNVVEESQAVKAVLDIKHAQHNTQYQRHMQALSQLQVLAPFDGLLNYVNNRRGEKPVPGQTVFPGSEIARIPNLSKLQAKLFVPSRYAVGLKVGMDTVIKLDAFPEIEINGIVQHVSRFPRSVQRGDPVTYYEVKVEIPDFDPSITKPGAKLKGTIKSNISDAALLVPLQAVHHDLDESYVFTKQGGSWVKTIVTPTKKNLHFVQLTSGVDENDVIALSVPDVFQ